MNATEILLLIIPLLAAIGFKIRLKNNKKTVIATTLFCFAYAGLLCIVVFINQLVHLLLEA
jgi:hypothetical protein